MGERFGKLAERYPDDKLDGEEFPAYVARKKREFIDRANEQRRRLKILRRALRLGAIDDLALLRGSLNEYEPIIADWQIENLLRACPYIGKSRSNEILEAARIPPSAKVGKLSYEKRAELARMVDTVRTPYG